ncbi:hypothetical protein [Runella sp.]|uniref:hypothetical protein n=1 Tax=Runella sp. TaxID=1960881 RepID=UPI003D11F28A
MKNRLLSFIALWVLLIGCSTVSCEDNIDESYCPEIDSTKKPLPSPSIKEINIFIDASGSMSGFMPATEPSTEFQILIPDIISKLETEFQGKVNIYPIYNSNSPLSPLPINDTQNKIINGTLAQKAGDTYIPTMLDSIYNGYFRKDAVNIFLSDCIYSPKNIQKKQAEQATREIRETISGYTKDYFTSVFCVFSQFNTIKNSPYYIIVFGKPENNHEVEYLIKNTINNKNQQFQQVNFGLQYNRPFYSVLPYTEISPNCIANPCANLNNAFANVSVQDWKEDSDTLSFWVAIDLTDFPSYATTLAYLDSNLVLTMQKGNATIIEKTLIAPKELSSDDKEIATKATHFIHIRILSLEDLVTTIQLKLNYSTPNWINTLNQTNSEKNGEKTFGLERLMNGFAEAYKQGKPTYFFNDLNISLIKQ